MTSQKAALTPLAVENIDLLRALQAGGHASPGALAEACGRDKSNIARTLKRLHGGGLIAEPAHDAALTETARQVLAAADVAEGRVGSGAPGATTAARQGSSASSPMPEGFALIDHARIFPDPLNPRKHFDPEALEELANSIATDGLLENLVVRPAETVDWADVPVHRLVAGERRWRAIKLLMGQGRWRHGANPCKVLDIDDAAHRRIALVENLQRKDLRPIDEAQALKELMAVTGQGTAEVAEQIGFTQRFVQQRLQLLQLPEKTRDAVNAGTLSLERAREEIARINRATEEAERCKLPPDELLALAEIATACERHGQKLTSWLPAFVPVGHRALEDGEVLHRLAARNAIDIERGWRDLPLNFVRPSYTYSTTELNSQLPGFSGKKRDYVLLKLGERVHGAAEAARIASTLGRMSGERGEYFTWALNEPFCSTPDPSLEETARAWAEREQADRSAEFERSARDAKAKAQHQAAQLAAAQKAQALAAALPSNPAIADQIREMLGGGDIALPLRADADGELWTANDDYLLTDAPAVAYLIAAIINTAAGLPTPAIMVSADPADEEAA